MSGAADVGEVDTSPAPPRGRRLTVALAAVVLLAGAALVVVPRLGGDPPGDASAEAGFARDMSVHHAQAVQMSFLVRDRTEDERVRLLAYDIINTQRAQIGMMTAWLDEWDLPKTDPGGSMAWMAGGHGHGGSADGSGGGSVGGALTDMPGMASPAELAQLRAASGREAEVIFLRLMVVHHRAGVDMAEAVLSRTGHARVSALARAMVDGQRSEITLMNGMLRARGAPAA